MEKFSVVVIGGGSIRLGILRDLSMRGVKALLVEKNDLVNDASSCYHGLLRSGGRMGWIRVGKLAGVEIGVQPDKGTFFHEHHGRCAQMKTSDVIVIGGGLEG